MMTIVVWTDFHSGDAVLAAGILSAIPTAAVGVVIGGGAKRTTLTATARRKMEAQARRRISRDRYGNDAAWIQNFPCWRFCHASIHRLCCGFC